MASLTHTWSCTYSPGTPRRQSWPQKLSRKRWILNGTRNCTIMASLRRTNRRKLCESGNFHQLPAWRLKFAFQENNSLGSWSNRFWLPWRDANCLEETAYEHFEEVQPLLGARYSSKFAAALLKDLFFTSKFFQVQQSRQEDESIRGKILVALQYNIQQG